MNKVLKGATQRKPTIGTMAGLIKTGLLWVLCTSGQASLAQSLLPYVQPLSGTAPSTTPAAQKHSEAGSEKAANTIPAVGLPFGMTQWTAQTRTNEQKCIPPYFYNDSLLSGFRGTHWISGSCMQDYGSVTIMPVVGRLKTAGYALPFSHRDEKATPGSYTLQLPAAHLVAEMSATTRCGILRFTMQQADSLYLLVVPNSDRGEGFVQVNKATGEIWGYNPAHRIYQGWGEPAGFSGYFFIRVEKKPATAAVFAGTQVLEKDRITHQKEAGAVVGFRLAKGEQLVLRIGTSFCSVDGARKNLATEMPVADFNAVVASAKKIWESALSQIRVETKSEKDKRIFYTALYHTLQHPRLFNDVDGRYPAFSAGGVVKKEAGDYYDDFSMWDIYRAQLPLLEILAPTRVSRFVQSLVLKGEQGGWLPIFPCWNNYTAAMIGDHATAFIASAFAKGIRSYDVPKAYALMRRNAFDLPSTEAYRNGKGRRALASYLAYGYVPLEDSVPDAFHKKEQVSRTLEYAYDDYALSVVAKALRQEDDYRLLQQRALNYRKVFDTTVRMVRGRSADGSWVRPFRPDSREFYITEGTPRQYSFYVPQDMDGLTKLMGGKRALELALDSLFRKGEYWHGNEPGHQIPFLYNFTDAPWKTQQVVRGILAEEYSDGAGGLSGNDDAGQMSAWYVFAAMGMYPVDPVSGAYQLSTPVFDRLTLRLPNQKRWTITCHKTAPGAVFISRMTLNGKAYVKNFIHHADLLRGGHLEIWLSANAGTSHDKKN